MKLKLITLALLSLSTSTFAGVNITSINTGILANEPSVKFSNGSAKVRMTDGEFFKIAGMGDRVEFQSLSLMDWSFDNKVIYPWELPLTDTSHITHDDILIVTATARHNASKEYQVAVIKTLEGGSLTLRVVSVIPEPSTYVLLLGLLALIAVLAYRHY